MKRINYLLILLIAVGLFSSCNKKIQELQTDPNNPTSVPPNLILGTVLTDISGTGSQGNLGGINSWDDVHAWNQYHCQNYDYYGNNMYSWSSGSFDPYLVLKNVAQMEKEAVAKGASSVNPFEAVGRFVRAYYYYNLTSLFGDVPEEQALQTGNYTPAYTSQEKVFQYILNQLDSANTDFTTLISNNDFSLSTSQDIFYGSSYNTTVSGSSEQLAHWQKLVNTFKLRVLISLSGKSADATLNVGAQFASIINNPAKYPVFTNPDDDFRFFYNPGGSNTYSTYPFNNSNYGSIAGRYNMSATYVGALTALNDPRVFFTCEPASNYWNTEFILNGFTLDSSYTVNGSVYNCYKKSDSDAIQPKVLYDAANPVQYKLFVGASTGEPLSTMYPNASAGKYSFINRHRYYLNFTGEPDVLVGYKEMCFNIAEAIERGWITGNAETWYKTGITASMAFYGIDVSQTNFSAYFMPAGATAPSQAQAYPFTFDFTSYYNQSSVKLSSTTTTAINQIVLQKYLACFENSGYEGYYNWRRTGVPAFQSGTGVGNGGVIPKRWAYPVSEQTQNTTNYKAALTNQGFSADDLNQTMWLLK